MVDVATNQQRGMSGDGPHQSLHQQDVDHGGLATTSTIGIRASVGVPFEAAAFGSTLEQPGDVLARHRWLGHALGGTARRGTQKRLTLAAEDAQDRVGRWSSCHPGPAGDDEHLRTRGQSDRGDLTWPTTTVFCSINGSAFSEFDVGPGQFSRQRRSAGNDCSAR